ncbi:MAG TPA: PAS domain-containing protein [Bryobacteraceae bacterium]|jgi:PAS domain S-box-containing protein|nr:PAS domain-containing protein [Bryobacteraceae bacterium]
MNNKNRQWERTTPTLTGARKSRLFDNSIVGTPQETVDFITNILESSTEYSVVAKDLEGKILLWNEGARRLYGYEPEEVVGVANSSILHTPEDILAGVPRQIMQTAIEQHKWEGTLTRQRKNGEQFLARVVITPRYDATGTPTGLLMISKDITGEVRITQYARSLIESSLDPLVTISPEGKITDVNEATVKVTGVPRERLIGTDFSNYFTEPERARSGYREVFEKGFVTDYPLTIHHEGGRLTDVLYNASVYKDANGAVLGVFAAARDVTAQKQASQYARSLIEASLDPLVTISADGKITDVNEATVRVTGLAREKLIGTDFSNYFTEPEQARAGYRRVFEQGFVTDYPLTIRHEGGRLSDVLYNASEYKDAAGKVLGVFAAARDITAQKQASQYARSLIEASLDPLVTISPEGTITDVNEATVRVNGVPRTELIGTDFSNYFTAPDQAREGYRKVFEKGFVTDYPLTIRHASGKLTWVLYNASVYRDVKGHVLGVFASARDITAQKQASQYARSLIEASLDPLVTISPEGIITDVNEATVKVTGVSREKLIGTDFSNYFTEPDKARVGYREVFEKGFVTNYPLTIRQESGKLTDVLYNASIYRDTEGNPLGIFAAARDVTESRRVTREFTETKNFLDNILQSSTRYSIIGKDLNHCILSWNEGARRNYGYRAEEIIGTDSSVLHTPEDIQSGKVAELLALAHEKGLAEGEFQRVRKDRSRFAASVVVTRRDDASGHPIGYLLMSNDISEKKLAEEQLRYASQYSRSLIEASLDPLVTISPEGKITDVNDATVKVTGASREQLIGADFANYFTEPEKARAGYQRAFSKGFVTDYPLTIHHAAGRLTDVLYNASVYKDSQGNVLGVFAAARDVTILKKTEAELAEQRSRELDRLAELERFQKLTVGRELKMIELKKEIEALKRRLVESQTPA